MILTMTRMFDMRQGRYSILAHGDKCWWVMEREWLFNKPFKSCVPRDEYTLSKHHSNRYPHTWAVIGDGVSHGKTEGVPRYACVFHSAVYPMQLQGCFAPCFSIGSLGEAIDSIRAMFALRALLDSATGTIKILMQ